VKTWSKGTAVCALLAIVAFAAGCGGGDDSSASGSADSGSLSKEDFVKKAKAACARAEEGAVGKGTAYIEKHGNEGLSEEALNRRGIKITIITLFEGRIKAIRALGAPEGDGQKLNEILTTLEADLETVKEQPPRLSLTALANLLPSNDELRGDGLNECGF
jgi:hypothetical protein